MVLCYHSARKQTHRGNISLARCHPMETGAPRISVLQGLLSDSEISRFPSKQICLPVCCVCVYIDVYITYILYIYTQKQQGALYDIEGLSTDKFHFTESGHRGPLNSRMRRALLYDTHVILTALVIIRKSFHFFKDKNRMNILLVIKPTANL